MFYNDGMHNRSGERKGIEMKSREEREQKAISLLLMLSESELDEFIEQFTRSNVSANCGAIPEDDTKLVG